MVATSHLAMNFDREPPEKCLVDTNSHLNVHQRVPNYISHLFRTTMVETMDSSVFTGESYISFRGFSGGANWVWFIHSIHRITFVAAWRLPGVSLYVLAGPGKLSVGPLFVALLSQDPLDATAEREREREVTIFCGLQHVCVLEVGIYDMEEGQDLYHFLCTSDVGQAWYGARKNLATAWCLSRCHQWERPMRSPNHGVFFSGATRLPPGSASSQMVLETFPTVTWANGVFFAGIRGGVGTRVWGDIGGDGGYECLFIGP